MPVRGARVVAPRTPPSGFSSVAPHLTIAIYVGGGVSPVLSSRTSRPGGIGDVLGRAVGLCIRPANPCAGPRAGLPRRPDLL